MALSSRDRTKSVPNGVRLPLSELVVDDVVSVYYRVLFPTYAHPGKETTHVVIAPLGSTSREDRMTLDRRDLRKILQGSISTVRVITLI